MPRNEIVLYLNDDPWTLAGLLCAAGGLSMVLAFITLFLMLWRWGTSRRLSAAEAARVAIHPAEPSYVDSTLLAHGPAMGKEWKLSMSIGDFRRAWQAQDYWKFFTMPLCQLLMWGGGLLAMFGVGVGVHSWIPFVAAASLGVPALLILVFVIWAAFFTKLE